MGCYADVNDDGTVDGVIYADLARGTTGSGEWGSNGNGIYKIPKRENLKVYKVSEKTKI